MLWNRRDDYCIGALYPGQTVVKCWRRIDDLHIRCKWKGPPIVAKNQTAREPAVLTSVVAKDVVKTALGI
jgi:hypothetical protein